MILNLIKSLFFFYRVLRLLEQIRQYSSYLIERLERTSAGVGPLLGDDMDRHPCPAVAALMKLSFDEEHRGAMCLLGGLQAIAELVRRDHQVGTFFEQKYFVQH